MNELEKYGEFALQFPSLWPSMPEWNWVSVHDGVSSRLDVIAQLLEGVVESAQVVVIVHAQPGIGVVLPRESATNYIAKYVLQYDVQASDPIFNRFVSISRIGVATSDAR